MRVHSVVTNSTCNQNCRYCTARRAVEDRAFVQRAATLARIDEALRGGAAELILTGGEPTLRSDLAALVAHAKRGGASRVVLETNATLIDEPRARELAGAGLALARVNLAAWGDALDALTRDPGGFARAEAGLRALAAAGVPVQIAVAIVRSTIAHVAELPARLRALLGPALAGIVVRVPDASPEPDELVAYEDAAAAIAALDGACRREGVGLKLAQGSGPPPCVFENRARVAHLWSLTPGGRADAAGFRRVDACAACRASDRCAGFPETYLARRAPPALHPIDDDRLRRRLSLVSTVEEQIRREMVTPNRSRTEGDVDEQIVRVQFQCNQACDFCFVSTHLPAPRHEDVVRAILETARGGMRVVVSGGEPTLSPRLAEYVALAARESALPVELQTNAVLLEDASRVAELEAAGLGLAFVSLHASDAPTSDAITRAPGTFVRTLAGLDNLARSRVRVRINFVICAANRGHLVPFVRMVATRWPGAEANVSFVAPSTDVVPREERLVPRYSDIVPELAEAIAEAKRLGVTLHGFDSMCGIPLCLVPAELHAFFDLSVLPEGFDQGEFVRADACRGCALEGRCFGIRRGYAELYGTGELRRIDRGPSAHPR